MAQKDLVANCTKPSTVKAQIITALSKYTAEAPRLLAGHRTSRRFLLYDIDYDASQMSFSPQSEAHLQLRLFGENRYKAAGNFAAEGIPQGLIYTHRELSNPAL
ncbi:hypothetical protein [Arthrobacter globiformis]|uniref:hypothetical protein n=1 Tax=Arthrobacter globiformis TaxID=1665 RepID=UPI00167EAB67|nr:hypothetical protein [Arthrobacter globiformis]